MVSSFYKREKAPKSRNIIHSNKRCPRCNEYNLRIAVNRKRYGIRYFMVCTTPGCWFYTGEARTQNGAIRNWNKDAGRTT